MRRIKKRRYSLETIVMSLIFVPPLGFLLLWITARTRRTRIIVLTAFVLFAVGVTGAFVKSGRYSRLKDHSIPQEGFDVSHDSRGRYVTKEILPFERQIFREVVREMRRTQPESIPSQSELIPIETAEPERKAFERVADRHDLYYDDVKGIYLKVTTQLVGAE